jgi:phosphatidate cytidylyltransferase
MKARILSTIVGAPLLLGAILWPGGGVSFPGWPFALLVLLLMVVSLHEFYAGCRTVGRKPLEPGGHLAILLLWLISIPPWREQGNLLFRFGMTLLIGGTLAWEALRKERAPLRNLAPTWLGIIYLGGLFPFAVRLRTEAQAANSLHWTLPGGWMQEVGAGGWLMLFTVLIVMAVDTGAFFAGKTLGRHKLAPEVSPGKTWEGSVGGFAAGVLVAILLSTWLRLPTAFAVVAALMIGVLGQVGDLSKSAIKREIGIKDFGTVIPGHGGVLDRFDSLLFATPAVYWLVALWP